MAGTGTLTARRWWVRLSGDELRARLAQRGVMPGRVELLVRGRDTETHAHAIDRLLGAE